MTAETQKIPSRRCQECGAPFPIDPKKGGSPQRYCTPEHKRAWENRQLARGQGLVVLAQAWRQGRHRKKSDIAKWALNEFATALDRMSAEDKATGRMSALDILADRHRSEGTLGAGK